MSATKAEDMPITDDDWRAEKFTEDQLASARLLGDPPSYEKLVRHMERFGTDGILESAIFLPRPQYEKLERKVREIGLPRIRRGHLRRQ